LLLKSDPVVKTIAAEIDFFHGGDQVWRITFTIMVLVSFFSR
jgi:hypothetical protein